MNELNMDTTWADKAEAVLQEQAKDVAKVKGLTGNQGSAVKYMAGKVGEVLIKFCYQSEDFSQAVVERKGELSECLTKIVKDNWTSGISDVEAYAEAVKYYMPGAKVRATFRIEAPVEHDDDLDFGCGFDVTPASGAGEADGETKAIILDLFGDGGDEA